jgi:outer membrane protein assembly factor BamD (BamD/ComL family)
LKINKNLDTKVSYEEKNFITKQEKQNKLTFEDSKLYSAALDYYDKKNNTKAIELLDKIIKKHPEFQAAKIARSKIK